jgi:hypothetical protein
MRGLFEVPRRKLDLQMRIGFSRQLPTILDTSYLQTLPVYEEETRCTIEPTPLAARACVDRFSNVNPVVLD